jgi:hypothetical protein
MVELGDVSQLLDFFQKSPVRYRALIHDLVPPDPDWDMALRHECGISDTRADTYYVDSWINIQCVLRIRTLSCARASLRVEGELGPPHSGQIAPDELAHWTQKLAPSEVTTTHAPIRDVLGQALDIDRWQETVHYTVSPEGFPSRMTQPISQLDCQDRPVWRAFLDRHQDDPLVTGVLAHAYACLCAGLPIRMFAAHDRDGDFGAVIAVQEWTGDCDEILALYGAPSSRDEGALEAALCAFVTRNILKAGRRPTYACVGKRTPEPFDLLGYAPVARTWTWAAEEGGD